LSTSACLLAPATRVRLLVVQLVDKGNWSVATVLSLDWKSVEY
jgi:hypothetical protein